MIKFTGKALAVSAALTFSASAFAADLPTSKPAPVFPASGPYNWSGFYVGGYAGGSFGTTSFSDLSFPNFNGIGNLSSTSFTGGILNGYNVQFSAFVVGAEVEFGYDGRHGSGSFLNPALATRDYQVDGSYIGRLRARAGYALDNILIYAAAGLSVGNLQAKFTNPFNGFNESIAQDLVGYNIGGGVEYAFTQNWIARVEYIYDGFGARTYSFNITPPTGSLFDTDRIKLSENTVRAGVEYKF
ncbi:outer membrane protein [Methylocapsa sp. S129]|uniref:outer membrane protein n=1 Tax=Methylocapsa sp. S129 TaxID=1641869 RepID=UPI00131CA4DE|nr:outer membrane protein [Methylocapsa sp. S129]